MVQMRTDGRPGPVWSPRALRGMAMALLFAVFLATILIYTPNFFRPGNLINVLVQTSMLGILATGMTLVMIGGGIDLSLPANMALSGILGSMVMVGVGSAAAGCAAMMLTGGLIGVLNGIAIAYLRMIPFVVTLAMLSVCGGLSVWITNSVSISNQPEAFYEAVLSRPMGVPVPVLIMLAVAGFGQVLTGQTRFGRHLYALGTNPVAARIARVPVQGTVFASYALAGLAAGIAAIVITARLGSASANVGNDSVILDVVTACVIGGVSIYGGVGRPLGALFGAVFVLVLGNLLNLVGISFFVGLMLKGAVIIALVALDRAVGAGR